MAGDITESSLSNEIAQVAEKEFYRLDGLVVNQGMLEPVERIADANIEAWQNNFNVNVFSAVQLVGHASLSAQS